ncbi:hypothetical protein D8Y31_23765 [Escherichia coli]|nr:hypothetical protein D8Y31_23765 [Escherichia coli]
MPAFEWVHVQLHQQKGMISLSPPTICNSAAEAAPAATTLVASCVVITAIVVPVITALWAKHGASRVRAT